nr:MAG TPA: hypothetical protein [Caudoviricetes sp.]
MQAHDNHYIKRAGVAGIRARACGKSYVSDRFMKYTSGKCIGWLKEMI